MPHLRSPTHLRHARPWNAANRKAMGNHPSRIGAFDVLKDGSSPNPCGTEFHLILFGSQHWRATSLESKKTTGPLAGRPARCFVNPSLLKSSSSQSCALAPWSIVLFYLLSPPSTQWRFRTRATQLPNQMKLLRRKQCKNTMSLCRNNSICRENTSTVCIHNMKTATSNIWTPSNLCDKLLNMFPNKWKRLFAIWRP